MNYRINLRSLDVCWSQSLKASYQLNPFVFILANLVVGEAERNIFFILNSLRHTFHLSDMRADSWKDGERSLYGATLPAHCHHIKHTGTSHPTVCLKFWGLLLKYIF